MTTIVAKDNTKKRVMSLMPVKTVLQIDRIRGYYSRSQFMQMAVDKFLENIQKEKKKENMGRKQSTLLQGSDVVGPRKKSQAASGVIIAVLTNTPTLHNPQIMETSVSNE